MKKTSRRSFLKASALAAASIPVMSSLDVFGVPADPAFALPALKYPHEALEPHIDALTMQIHHSKHHMAYVTNLNKAVAEAGIKTTDMKALLKDASKLPAAVRNNGGGHYNHSLFWELMTPAGGGDPNGPVADAINSSFGSFAAFKEKFNAAATGRFGSGWAWLVASDGKLAIGSTPNQDNPLMDVSEVKGTPLLGLDVWEHAYYLKYQNRRVEYVNAWWNVVSWEEVNKRISSSK
jgi:Fe-Mn family superoxide dismutase